MRKIMTEKLLEFGKRSGDVFFVTADMGFGAFEPIAELFGNRYVNVGIAEQNMQLFAAGLALTGKKVFTYSISTFPTMRCLEQIRNGVCYHEADVITVAIGAGLEYGALGVTHHLTEDIAVMRALPNMRVYTPATDDETAMVFDEVFRDRGPAYIRLNKNGAAFCGGDNTVINTIFCGGGDTAVLACGTVLQEAIDYNAENKKKVDIYSVVCLSHGKERVVETIRKYKTVISLEEHQRTGGLYSYLCELKNDAGLKCNIIPVALKDAFTPKVGSQKELRAYYKLDKHRIAEIAGKKGDV